MRPKRLSFWKMRAQETREKKRRIARTARATQPVCARMSKMLPMKMADKREMMTAPQFEQNLAHLSKLAHEESRVKIYEMRCAKEVMHGSGVRSG